MLKKTSPFSLSYNFSRQKCCVNRRDCVAAFLSEKVLFSSIRIRDENLAKRGIDANNIEEQVTIFLKVLASPLRRHNTQH
jgi:hypothetical protein